MIIIPFVLSKIIIITLHKKELDEMTLKSFFEDSSINERHVYYVVQDVDYILMSRSLLIIILIYIFL